MEIHIDPLLLGLIVGAVIGAAVTFFWLVYEGNKKK